MDFSGWKSSHISLKYFFKGRYNIIPILTWKTSLFVLDFSNCSLLIFSLIPYKWESLSIFSCILCTFSFYPHLLKSLYFLLNSNNCMWAQMKEWLKFPCTAAISMGQPVLIVALPETPTVLGMVIPALDSTQQGKGKYELVRYDL